MAYYRTLTAVLVAIGVAACAKLTAAQCFGSPEIMSCNVPYWCQLRVGGFPVYNLETDDCICWQLCNDAFSQGEGSTCTYQDIPNGGRWFSIMFNKYNADNNYRGTVYCDPRGHHGDRRMSKRLLQAVDSGAALVGSSITAAVTTDTAAPRKLLTE